jgi:hypothetical protein
VNSLRPVLQYRRHEEAQDVCVPPSRAADAFLAKRRFEIVDHLGIVQV